MLVKTQKNFLRAFPVVVREGTLHMCRGRFGSHTHSGVEEIEAIVGSKGVHGSIKRPEFAHNHGPFLKTSVMSSGFAKVTAKKP